LKALVIAAHGSRKKDADKQILELADRIRARLHNCFDRVDPAFLQFSQPELGQKLEELVLAGADHVVVFPFFISRGSHISSDLPELINKARQKFPAAEFTLTRHLGIIEGLDDLICREVTLSFHCPQQDQGHHGKSGSY